MPYILRAAALDEKLEPHYLGRALYHLAQRRGFLSGRLKPAKKDDDEGVVKEGIGELRQKMQEAKVRTLGEYFSRLSPSEERVRCRWTARDMYEKEFDAIWAAQALHHPALLTDERRKELRKAIFFQRPLWFDPNTVGTCELEPGERRAPAYDFISQHFRLIQKVSDLEVEMPGEPPRPLNPEERAKLTDALLRYGDLSFHKARKANARSIPSVRELLSLPKKVSFNLQRGGEEKIPGNRTVSQFYAVFGQRWLEMSAEEHRQCLLDVLSIHNPEALKRRALNHWKLDEDAADRFCEISLEPDYANLSRRAMEKLLPLMEIGTRYAEARKTVYPESFQSRDPKPLLPPVEMALTETRNPAVMRSLTELRKVVNAIIRQYGKPQEIHVELARDLKKSKKQRKATAESNRRNEKTRAEAAKRIMAEAGITQPKPDDIRKFLLAEESSWMCPYTGRSISVASLFGPEAQFDFEHIIPFSRSMDNRFFNLTLCHIPENRSVKGNKTPHQAYAGDSERYEQILDRVRKFTGERSTVAAKLKRFMMNDEELEIFLEDFRNRQLNDTAYASKLAKSYVALLYGGDVDGEGRRRVQATSGQTTAHFRSQWKLYTILNDGPSADGGRKSKSRTDHRHHAVDAVVIGLTDARMVKRLSDAAQRAPLEHRRRFASLEAPWPNFVDSVRAEIDKVVVSHRVSKKVSGALHKDTNYSPETDSEGRRHHRVPLTELTEKNVMSEEVVVDAGGRKRVREKLRELGGGDPGKLFAAPENLPCFQAADGRKIPIKKVRVAETIKTRKIGEGPRARFVKPGGNHHLEIFAQPGLDGQDKKWDTPGVVTMLDAYDRIRNCQPVAQRHAQPGWEFRFSLAQGETLECDDGPGKRRLLVVRTISEEEKKGSVKIEMVPINDARQKDEIRKSKQWITKSPNELRKLNARKVVVSPLGEVSESHE